MRQNLVPDVVLVAALLASGAALAEPQPPAAEAAPLMKVTYVGNEGFLVERNGKKVLIDALYRAGVPGYPVHSDQLREQLEWARPPFDGVDLVLATHIHNDHFEPNSAGKYLIENREAVLVTTPQAADRLMREFAGFEAVRGRVHAVYPPEGQKKKMDFGSIQLTVMTLHHGRDVPFQNVGFLVEIDGRKFLHLGDSQAAHAEVGRYGLPAENIDVAFVPFWVLIESAGVRMVKEAIAPDKVVPMHIPVEAAPPVLFGAGTDHKGVMALLRSLPGVILFERPLDSRDVR